MMQRSETTATHRKPTLGDIPPLATGNEKKRAEFSRIIGYEISKVTLNPGPVEPQPSDKHELMMRAGHYMAAAEDIASAKAKDAYVLNKNAPVLIEDTGLYIDALDGLPGPLIRFNCTDLGLKRLCRDVHDPIEGTRPTNCATAIVAISAWNGVDEKAQTWIGQITGTISPEPRGSNGFGWDSIFIPDGSSKTFAEMDSQEKDRFSMRRLAIEELKARPFKRI